MNFISVGIKRPACIYVLYATLKRNLVYKWTFNAMYLIGNRTLQHICEAYKSHNTKANLAKELQLPTHGNRLSIQKVTTNLYYIFEQIAGLKKIKKTEK